MNLYRCAAATLLLLSACGGSFENSVESPWTRFDSESSIGPGGGGTRSKMTPMKSGYRYCVEVEFEGMPDAEQICSCRIWRANGMPFFPGLYYPAVGRVPGMEGYEAYRQLCMPQPKKAKTRSRTP